MNKKYKIISKFMLSIFFIAFFVHWFFGTAVFTKYSYLNFDKNKFATNSLKFWLSSLSENNRGYLKKVWPNDTIIVYSSKLDLISFSLEGIVIIPKKLNKILTVDSPWVRIELDHKDVNPFFYNYHIFGNCYLDKKDSVLMNAKMKSWSVSYKGFRYHWVPNEFTGIKPTK